MKLTDALLGEHGVLVNLMNHLERVLPTETSLSSIHALGAMFSNALLSHAHLEEELLFVRLETQLGPMGPLSVMRHEHQDIEGTLEHLPTIGNLTKAVDSLHYALNLAREHFEKEEQVLFMLAAQQLDGAELERLGQTWAEQRGISLPGADNCCCC